MDAKGKVQEGDSYSRLEIGVREEGDGIVGEGKERQVIKPLLSHIDNIYNETLVLYAKLGYFEVKDMKLFGPPGASLKL